MKRYVFTKKRESIPVIKNKKVIDPGAGGIKVEYHVHATDNIRIRIGNRDIYIPYWRYEARPLVFIKLLKDYWDNETSKLSANHWNKKDKIWTNMWVIVRSRLGSFNCYADIVDITKDFKTVRVKTKCTKKEHHQMIKHLDKGETKFRVPYVQIIF